MGAPTHSQLYIISGGSSPEEMPVNHPNPSRWLLHFVIHISWFDKANNFLIIWKYLLVETHLTVGWLVEIISSLCSVAFSISYTGDSFLTRENVCFFLFFFSTEYEGKLWWSGLQEKICRAEVEDNSTVPQWAIGILMFT